MCVSVVLRDQPVAIGQTTHTTNYYYYHTTRAANKEAIGAGCCCLTGCIEISFVITCESRPSSRTSWPSRDDAPRRTTPPTTIILQGRRFLRGRVVSALSPASTATLILQYLQRLPGCGTISITRCPPAPSADRCRPPLAGRPAQEEPAPTVSCSPPTCQSPRSWFPGLAPPVAVLQGYKPVTSSVSNTIATPGFQVSSSSSERASQPIDSRQQPVESQ